MGERLIGNFNRVLDAGKRIVGSEAKSQRAGNNFGAVAKSHERISQCEGFEFGVLLPILGICDRLGKVHDGVGNLGKKSLLISKVPVEGARLNI